MGFKAWYSDSHHFLQPFLPKIQFGTQFKRASSQTIGKAAGAEEAETDRATKVEETDKVYQVAVVDPEGEIAQVRLI